MKRWNNRLTKAHIEDFLTWDIVTLAEHIQKRKISPVEVTKSILERIEAVDKELNAYVTVTKDLALKQAKEAEEEIGKGQYKGPLHGVPIAIKDNIYTKDIKTTMGSGVFADHYPTYDATVVKKLAEAGAICLGKLNMHEIAYGTTGDRSYFGPTKNGLDYSKIPGGSSSGSAAAIVEHLCYAALGTDTGGSIRIPAAFQGLVGMKPTFGRVSNHGVFPLAFSLDHVGPLTKTVYDNALLLKILAGDDAKDPYAKAVDVPNYTAKLQEPLEQLTIGIPSNRFFTELEETVEKEFQRAIEKLKALGHTIKEIELPDPDAAINAFRTILRNEAFYIHHERLEKFPDKWDEEVKERLLTAKGELALNLVEAQQIRQQTLSDYDKVYEIIDVLVMPTVPIMPFDIGKRDITFKGEVVHSSLLLNKFTGIFNMTGFPGLSIPTIKDFKGLPVGLQFVGEPFTEEKLYQLAYQYEQ